MGKGKRKKVRVVKLGSWERWAGVERRREEKKMK